MKEVDESIIEILQVSKQSLESTTRKLLNTLEPAFLNPKLITDYNLLNQTLSNLAFAISGAWINEDEEQTSSFSNVDDLFTSTPLSFNNTRNIESLNTLLIFYLSPEEGILSMQLEKLQQLCLFFINQNKLSYLFKDSCVSVFNMITNNILTSMDLASLDFANDSQQWMIYQAIHALKQLLIFHKDAIINSVTSIFVDSWLIEFVLILLTSLHQTKQEDYKSLIDSSLYVLSKLSARISFHKGLSFCLQNMDRLSKAMRETIEKNILFSDSWAVVTCSRLWNIWLFTVAKLLKTEHINHLEFSPDGYHIGPESLLRNRKVFFDLLVPTAGIGKLIAPLTMIMQKSRSLFSLCNYNLVTVIVSWPDWYSSMSSYKLLLRCIYTISSPLPSKSSPKKSINSENNSDDYNCEYAMGIRFMGEAFCKMLVSMKWQAFEKCKDTYVAITSNASKKSRVSSPHLATESNATVSATKTSSSDLSISIMDLIESLRTQIKNTSASWDQTLLEKYRLWVRLTYIVGVFRAQSIDLLTSNPFDYPTDELNELIFPNAKVGTQDLRLDPLANCKELENGLFSLTHIFNKKRIFSPVNATAPSNAPQQDGQRSLHLNAKSLPELVDIIAKLSEMTSIAALNESAEDVFSQFVLIKRLWQFVTYDVAYGLFYFIGDGMSRSVAQGCVGIYSADFKFYSEADDESQRPSSFSQWCQSTQFSDTLGVSFNLEADKSARPADQVILCSSFAPAEDMALRLASAIASQASLLLKASLLSSMGKAAGSYLSAARETIVECLWWFLHRTSRFALDTDKDGQLHSLLVGMIERSGLNLCGASPPNYMVGFAFMLSLLHCHSAALSHSHVEASTHRKSLLNIALQRSMNSITESAVLPVMFSFIPSLLSSYLPTNWSTPALLSGDDSKAVEGKFSEDIFVLQIPPKSGLPSQPLGYITCFIKFAIIRLSQMIAPSLSEQHSPDLLETMTCGLRNVILSAAVLIDLADERHQAELFGNKSISDAFENLLNLWFRLDDSYRRLKMAKEHMSMDVDVQQIDCFYGVDEDNEGHKDDNNDVATAAMTYYMIAGEHHNTKALAYLYSDLSAQDWESLSLKLKASLLLFRNAHNYVFESPNSFSGRDILLRSSLVILGVVISISQSRSLSGGAGESSDEFQLKVFEDLLDFFDSCDKYFLPDEIEIRIHLPTSNLERTKASILKLSLIATILGSHFTLLSKSPSLVESIVRSWKLFGDELETSCEVFADALFQAILSNRNEQGISRGTISQNLILLHHELSVRIIISPAPVTATATAGGVEEETHDSMNPTSDTFSPTINLGLKRSINMDIASSSPLKRTNAVLDNSFKALSDNLIDNLIPDDKCVQEAGVETCCDEECLPTIIGSNNVSYMQAIESLMRSISEDVLSSTSSTSVTTSTSIPCRESLLSALSNSHQLSSQILSLLKEIEKSQR